MISLSDRILYDADLDFTRRRKPPWIRAKLPGGPGYERLRAVIDGHNLHTVCESAKCPNMGECWSQGTATIMILGDVCTRSCGFCHVMTGRPTGLDTDEPRRVAESAVLLGLKHLVITSVNRDELPDGGAGVWAQTIRKVRDACPQTAIEVLIPDFAGDWHALQLVLDAEPDVVNHNIETVRRLYPAVRPQAKYERSLELLRRVKQQGFIAKTGIMVGIGETDEEVFELMHDVVAVTGGGAEPSHRAAAKPAPQGRRGSVTEEPAVAAAPKRDSQTSRCCDILTIGQYLQPTRRHLPVARWVTPQQFAGYKQLGERIGLRHVEAGPMVRSSYHAHDQASHVSTRPLTP